MRLASRFGYANQIRRDRPLTHEELMHYVPGIFGEDGCARSLSARRPVNSLPVRWTGYLTRRRASVLPLWLVRFCVPSVTPWSLLPARYGTGFSSEHSARGNA